MLERNMVDTYTVVHQATGMVMDLRPILIPVTFAPYLIIHAFVPTNAASHATMVQLDVPTLEPVMNVKPCKRQTDRPARWRGRRCAPRPASPPHVRHHAPGYGSASSRQTCARPPSAAAARHRRAWRSAACPPPCNCRGRRPRLPVAHQFTPGHRRPPPQCRRSPLASGAPAPPPAPGRVRWLA